jgi:aminoglycoside 6'-N-acetyltransferase I
VAEDVFDNPVSPALAAEFLADPRHHLAVALDGETVVGMASALHYIHPDKPADLWINEVGVAPSHHRLGLGRRLVAALLARGRELGCHQAWVLTDEENAAARRLYAAAGGEETAGVIMVEFDLT